MSIDVDVSAWLFISSTTTTTTTTTRKNTIVLAFKPLTKARKHDMIYSNPIDIPWLLWASRLCSRIFKIKPWAFCDHDAWDDGLRMQQVVGNHAATRSQWDAHPAMEHALCGFGRLGHLKLSLHWQPNDVTKIYHSHGPTKSIIWNCLQIVRHFKLQWYTLIYIIIFFPIQIAILRLDSTLLGMAPTGSTP